MLTLPLWVAALLVFISTVLCIDSGKYLAGFASTGSSLNYFLLDSSLQARLNHSLPANSISFCINPKTKEVYSLQAAWQPNIGPFHLVVQDLQTGKNKTQSKPITLPMYSQSWMAQCDSVHNALVFTQLYNNGTLLATRIETSGTISSQIKAELNKNWKPTGDSSGRGGSINYVEKTQQLFVHIKYNHRNKTQPAGSWVVFDLKEKTSKVVHYGAQFDMRTALMTSPKVIFAVQFVNDTPPQQQLWFAYWPSGMMQPLGNTHNYMPATVSPFFNFENMTMEYFGRDSRAPNRQIAYGFELGMYHNGRNLTGLLGSDFQGPCAYVTFP